MDVTAILMDDSIIFYIENIILSIISIIDYNKI